MKKIKQEIIVEEKNLCPKCKQETIDVLTDGSVVCTHCGYFYPAN